MQDAYAPSLGLVLRRDTTAALQQRSPTLSSANAHVSDNPQADARRRTAGRQAEDCLRREGELSTHLRPSATSNSDRNADGQREDPGGLFARASSSEHFRSGLTVTSTPASRGEVGPRDRARRASLRAE